LKFENWSDKRIKEENRKREGIKEGMKMKSWKEVKEECKENGVDMNRLNWVDKRKGGRRRKVVGIGGSEKEKEIMERNGFRKYKSVEVGMSRGYGYWCWVRFEKEVEK